MKNAIRIKNQLYSSKHLIRMNSTMTEESSVGGGYTKDYEKARKVLPLQVGVLEFILIPRPPQDPEQLQVASRGKQQVEHRRHDEVLEVSLE